MQLSLPERDAELIPPPSSPMLCSHLEHKRKEQKELSSLGSPHSWQLANTISLLFSSFTFSVGRGLGVLLRPAMTWESRVRSTWRRNEAEVQSEMTG